MTSPTALPLNLRRHEIALVLNVGVTKVDQLIRANAFPSFKLGGTRLARREDVVTFNDSQARQSITDGSKENDDASGRTNTPHADTSTTPASSTPTANQNVIPMRGRKQKRGAR